MKSRIQLSLCYVGILAAIFASYFTAHVFKESLVKQLQDSLRQSANLVATAYSRLDSVQDLQRFASNFLRITLIDKDGKVIFESDGETHNMGNHMTRPEVTAAIQNGWGEGMRHSLTLNANIYYYALKLPDANILRLGMREANLQHLISRATPYLLSLIAVVIAASILIAFWLSRMFVRPVQKLAEKLNDVEILNDDSMYKEIAPFIKTIRNKNRELEITIEKLHQEEQKTSRIKDEFTANAAHELKTPLTTISGYAEMIENGMANPEDTVRFAGKIHREANRMLSIANDIMTLSKLDSPKDKTININENVNLWNIASECIESLSVMAQKKQITLSKNGDPASEVKGNSRLLFEMVYNLLDNAVRYTNIGGKVEVIINKSSISVKDNGIGIPEDCKERIFERFFRVDKSHSRESGGTGLGLAIVKHVTQVHNARIQLNSSVDVGTKITVEF